MSLMSLSSSSPSLPSFTPVDARRFIVGLDDEGHWLALETHGLGGGLFRDRDAALRYAALETDRRPGAVEIASERLALRL